MSREHPLATLCDQFLKERTYLKNVTPRTLVWYQVAFKCYRRSFSADTPSLPTKATLQQFVVHERDRGLRPVTCNTYIGAMNAFCVWLHQEGHIPERVKLPKLRVERRVLMLRNDTQMRVLIGYKPKTFRQARLHLATADAARCDAIGRRSRVGRGAVPTATAPKFANGGGLARPGCGIRCQRLSPWTRFQEPA